MRRDAHVDWHAIAPHAAVDGKQQPAGRHQSDRHLVRRAETQAVAGRKLIYWFAFFILLAGGVGLAVQTLVAQAE
jgi:hypothetical protein